MDDPQEVRVTQQQIETLYRLGQQHNLKEGLTVRALGVGQFHAGTLLANGWSYDGGRSSVGEWLVAADGGVLSASEPFSDRG